MGPSLLELLEELPDPRDPRGTRYPLVPVLALCLVAALAGYTTLAAISQFGRLRKHRPAQALGLKRGTSHAASILSALLRNLDAGHLDRIIGRWLAARHASGWEVHNLDGKTARSSRDGEAPGVPLLAAYAPQASAVVAQLRVDAMTDEHKAARRLLEVLPPLAGDRGPTSDAIEVAAVEGGTAEVGRRPAADHPGLPLPAGDAQVQQDRAPA